MITFKISEKEGLKYSKESGDINKIHLDKITGFREISKILTYKILK